MTRKCRATLAASPRRGLALCAWLIRALCLCCSFSCGREPRREHLEHGRFEHLQLSVPDSPRSVALLLAGSADQARADRLSAQLSTQGAVVTRVDAEAFGRVLAATPERCAYPAGDLDNLAHFVQAYLKLPNYQPAILLGLGTGAGLAAGALLQAPPDTFAGAIVFDLCATAAPEPPPCPADAPRQDAASGPTLVAPSPGAPLVRLKTRGKAGECASSASLADAEPASDEAAFASAFGSLARAAQAHVASTPGDLRDLPVVEVPEQGTDHPDIFGVLLSGDGGWAGLDQALSSRLAQRGLPIVGIDSLRYFWRARTPEGTAADLERVILHYQSVWKRKRVVLLGYSQGADVLPFIFNRLPLKTKSAVVKVVALSISTTATFEFHVRNWVGASGDRPTLPEVQRLAHEPFLCVYGKEDGDALCPALDPSAFRSVQLPGSHHFNGDYDRLSTIVLNALPPI